MKQMWCEVMNYPIHFTSESNSFKIWWNKLFQNSNIIVDCLLLQNEVLLNFIFSICVILCHYLARLPHIPLGFLYRVGNSPLPGCPRGPKLGSGESFYVQRSPVGEFTIEPVPFSDSSLIQCTWMYWSLWIKKFTSTLSWLSDSCSQRKKDFQKEF